jgi:imidazole glycerol-phosphate synthase subunit HisH
MTKVTIVDYGVGNLLSVKRGFEYSGIDAEVTADLSSIKNATRIVLPGVGAFRNGMDELKERNLIDVIRDASNRGVPILGICLGMQLLFEIGEEFGRTDGLGLVPGRVKAVSCESRHGLTIRVPHIGWNEIQPVESPLNWDKTVLASVNVRQAMYFNHSFLVEPTDSSCVVAVSEYGSNLIPAVIQHGSISGCQFHPEKSGYSGLQILKVFADH